MRKKIVSTEPIPAIVVRQVAVRISGYREVSGDSVAPCGATTISLCEREPYFGLGRRCFSRNLET